MEHVGIDLGGRESQVCVRIEDGTVLLERRMRMAALKKWVAGGPPSRVVMETCTESFSIADAAVAAGHQVRVVPGLLVKSLGVGARGVKTDKADARVLSQVSCRIDLRKAPIEGAIPYLFLDARWVRVPDHPDHRFRGKPIAHSGRSRSPIPEQADR